MPTATRSSARSRLRAARRRRRDVRDGADADARARLADDERAGTPAPDRPRRPRTTLSDAWRRFWAHPSPWLIGTTLVGAVVARVLVGGFHPSQLWIPAVMLASFPFVEWVVHVVVLHLRPTRVGPIRIDPLLSRSHRAHHADPRDLPLVFIPWQVLAWLLPLQVAGALLAFPTAASALTYLVVLGAIGMGYEWTHYLIHSDYVPRSRAYRAVWRNHRLHHYRNERYWFTVTTAGTADRVLGTYPDPADVPPSPTARDLLAGRP